MGRPDVAAQRAVVVGEVAVLTETHYLQCRGNRSLVRHENRPNHEHEYMLPGRRGDGVPEELQDRHQAVRHATPDCFCISSLLK